MKLFGSLLVLIIFFSCSKNSTDNTENSTPDVGAVNGNIKAYDKYGNANSNNSDVTITLIDKQNQIFTGSVNQTGGFSFNNIVLGEVKLAISKPGYGFTDSIKYNHQKVSDTLTDIYLIEQLPFSFQLHSAGYSNSMFNFSGSYNYSSTDSYMVTEFFCMSTDPAVSINKTNLIWSPGSQTNVQFIIGASGGSSSISFKTFTDAGFKSGDKIYVTLMPGITKFWSSYYDLNRNYEILHYKVENASNVKSFTLSQ